MKKKIIFWDNDGVLVDTDGLFFRAIQEVLSTVAVHVSQHMFVEHALKQGKSLFELAKRSGLGDSEIEHLKSRRDELYAHYLMTEDIEIVGIRQILEKLCGRIGLAVVTSAKRKHFDIIHERTKLLKYFDFVVTREDYIETKPAPDSYRKALQIGGVSPTEAVAVEDSQRGLRSARAAGIDCVVLPNTFTARSYFGDATKVVRNADELHKFLSSVA